MPLLAHQAQPVWFTHPEHVVSLSHTSKYSTVFSHSVCFPMGEKLKSSPPKRRVPYFFGQYPFFASSMHSFEYGQKAHPRHTLHVLQAPSVFVKSYGMRAESFILELPRRLQRVKKSTPSQNVLGAFLSYSYTSQNVFIVNLPLLGSEFKKDSLPMKAVCNRLCG